MAAPVRKDEELELTVDSLAYGGNGVARLNGFVVFVRRGLPGDTVRARVTKVKRGFAEALATEVLQPAPQRVEAPCAHYPACGGCRFQDLDYEAQIAAKAAQLRDALVRIGGIAEPPLEPIVPAVVAVLLPQQDGVLVHADAGRPDARLPQGRPLGRGARDRALLAHDRPRQRDPERRARVGARGGARGVRPGGAARLPPAPRRPRGPEHRPGARDARDRAGGEVRDRLLRRGPAPLPGGALDPLGDQRHAGRGHEPAVDAALGRGRDRGGAARPALPGAAERVPPDEHRDGRAALRARARVRRADGRRDRLRPLLRHRHDRARAGPRRAHRLGRRDLGGVGRVRDRERRPERDRQRRLLRRQRRPVARGARASARGSPTSSSSTRRARGWRARR